VELYYTKRTCWNEKSAYSEFGSVKNTIQHVLNYTYINFQLYGGENEYMHKANIYIIYTYIYIHVQSLLHIKAKYIYCKYLVIWPWLSNPQRVVVLLASQILKKIAKIKWTKQKIYFLLSRTGSANFYILFVKSKRPFLSLNSRELPVYGGGKKSKVCNI
jgi:hypothetical protein